MNAVFNQKGLQPYVRIVEQPARSAVRFRYECEGRSAGPIPGVNSSQSCATYPTIQIMNYSGNRAMVVVSCVTVNQPYKQHPHHLVGRVGCHNGICTMILDNSDHLCTFTHLGIQCAKRNEIANRLKLRKELGIDPTIGGFDHINKSARGVDLGAVRLCFQVYLENPAQDKFCIPLEPVISNPVYDKKLLSKLSITDISTNSALVTGGKVMLFCNYIDEDDIEVLFFECGATGMPIWQSAANLKPPFGEVHKRVGMSFMAPPYKNTTITQVVKCYMQLRRTSDHETSDPMSFYYLPINPPHICPYVEYQSVNTRSLTLRGYNKRYKNNINNDFNDNSEHNLISEESQESKVSHNLLKFEDIDSDIDVISSDNSFGDKNVNNCSNNNNNQKLINKNELIQNLFKDEMIDERNLSWRITDQNTGIQNNLANFSGQKNESNEENKHQDYSSYSLLKN